MSACTDEAFDRTLQSGNVFVPVDLRFENGCEVWRNSRLRDVMTSLVYKVFSRCEGFYLLRLLDRRFTQAGIAFRGGSRHPFGGGHVVAIQGQSQPLKLLALWKKGML
jgi:hypothetical protein